MRELRRHHEGTLLAGERAVGVKFIIDPSSGSLVMPVERWVIEWASQENAGSLFLPEERADALQVMVEFLSEPPLGAAQDRWTAYHADPRHRHWAQARVGGARREDEVSDDDAIDARNPWGASERTLLKALNADRRALAAACARLAGVKPDDPCAVGVDPLGVDVRARFGIVRAEFPASECESDAGLSCPERAAEVIARLLRDAGGTGT